MREVIVLGVVVLVAPAGCGRRGFDALADGSGTDGAPDGTDTSDGPPPVSCGGLAATCGPSGTVPCCESPVVGGGTFFRSYDTAADLAYPDMTRPATVSDFRLDRYELTVGRFRRFVLAGQGTQANPPPAGAGAHANIAGSGWDASWNGSLAADTTVLVAAIKCGVTYQTWTDTPAGNESRPITCVTWYEAMAFCTWDGGYLPTEAEWNYAASGGSLQRAYPWSSPPGATVVDCTVTNYGGASWPGTACVGAGASNVGSASPNGDGVWGQSDLGGNAWEWALDWYAVPYLMPCTDCANLFPATPRVFRSGSFSNGATTLRAGYRGYTPPSSRYSDIGFRCARTP